MDRFGEIGRAVQIIQVKGRPTQILVDGRIMDMIDHEFGGQARIDRERAKLKRLLRS